MPAQPDELVVLAGVYQDRQVALAERTASLAGRLWDQLGDLDGSRFVDQVVPLVGAAQEASIVAGDAYIASYAAAATDTAPTTATADVARLQAGLRNGTPLEVVYQRPVITARRVAGERGLDAALRVARNRVVMSADTDVMLAWRAGTDDAMRRDSRTVGYRRVPDAGACEFCLLASTQRYTRGDLMPLHPNCHCSVAPIIGSVDPGQVLDRDLANRLSSTVTDVTERRAVQRARRAVENAQTPTGRDLAEERLSRVQAQRAETLRRRRENPESLIAVHTHGELGPTLRPAGVAFTGPSNIPAA